MSSYHELKYMYEEKTKFYRRLEDLCDTIQNFKTLQDSIYVRNSPSHSQNAYMARQQQSKQEKSNFVQQISSKFDISNESFKNDLEESIKSKLLSKQEVFKKIFLGDSIDQSQTFAQIQAFSPTGKPKLLKITNENLKNFSKYIVAQLNEKSLLNENQRNEDLKSHLTQKTINHLIKNSVQTGKKQQHSTKTDWLKDNQGIKNDGEPIILNRKIRKAQKLTGLQKNIKAACLLQSIQQQPQSPQTDNKSLNKSPPPLIQQRIHQQTNKQTNFQQIQRLPIEIQQIHNVFGLSQKVTLGKFSYQKLKKRNKTGASLHIITQTASPTSSFYAQTQRNGSFNQRKNSDSNSFKRSEKSGQCRTQLTDSNPISLKTQDLQDVRENSKENFFNYRQIFNQRNTCSTLVMSKSLNTRPLTCNPAAEALQIIDQTGNDQVNYFKTQRQQKNEREKMKKVSNNSLPFQLKQDRLKMYSPPYRKLNQPKLDMMRNTIDQLKKVTQPLEIQRPVNQNQKVNTFSYQPLLQTRKTIKVASQN